MMLQALYAGDFRPGEMKLEHPGCARAGREIEQLAGPDPPCPGRRMCRLFQLWFFGRTAAGPGSQGTGGAADEGKMSRFRIVHKKFTIFKA